MNESQLCENRELPPIAWADQAFDLDDCDIDMSDFPRSAYSVRDVRRAGEVIADSLLWNEDSAPRIREAFHIANNWRDAHAYPMRSIHSSIRALMRFYEIDGDCGARLKRMQAIRRKLRRENFPQNLTQIQDLGGCRAILPTVADVRRLVDILRNRTRCEIWKEDPYIDRPKDDGYRSHHIRLKFVGKGEKSIYDGRRIEVQVRTKLQHSWATAVEAVGMMRREGLKNHHGSTDWLRLFALMSGEFAELERCPPPPGVPSHDNRVAEIKELDRVLDAYNSLNQIGYVTQWADSAIEAVDPAGYYLIKFDNITKQVVVEPHFRPLQAVASYDSAEASDNETDNENFNVVLVEADKVRNLRGAFPNYFGDVSEFKWRLGSILERGTADYTVRPQETAPIPPKEPFLGWWFNRKNRRWKE